MQLIAPMLSFCCHMEMAVSLLTKAFAMLIGCGLRQLLSRIVICDTYNNAYEGCIRVRKHEQDVRAEGEGDCEYGHGCGSQIIIASCRLM